VEGGIPRFVEDASYAESFGEQWARYRRVQLDSITGKPLSRDRLVEGTGWRLEELGGERVLEVGCGAGRFTEVLAATGAEVWAVDASRAVDACAQTVGDAPNVRLAQADLFDLPFAPGSFDRVLCYGVLQHTPDPRAGFLALVEQLRPGGVLAADVYRKAEYVDRWSAKYLWRPVTTRLPRRWLRRLVAWYIPRWLPVDTRLARVPRVGRFLVAAVPCWNYTGLLPLSRHELAAWAVLDTFDALSPRYDKPQTLDAVRAWCGDAGLVDVDVRPGGNGILITGRRGVRPP
jgi:2-polyprenyl-3-methyl-5-hydroxy-6-metoxy-1,4-benzoquinol methylase